MVLRISSEQMAALREIWVSPLVEELLDHVERRRGAARPLHPELGRRMITDAVMTTRRHALSDSAALRRYVELVTDIGEDLGQGEAAAWSGPLFDDPWLTDMEKIMAIEQAAVEQGLVAPR